MSNCCVRRSAKFHVDSTVRCWAIANIREGGVKRPPVKRGLTRACWRMKANSKITLQVPTNFFQYEPLQTNICLRTIFDTNPFLYELPHTNFLHTNFFCSEHFTYEPYPIRTFSIFHHIRTGAEMFTAKITWLFVQRFENIANMRVPNG